MEVMRKGTSQSEASRNVVEGKKKKSEAGGKSGHMEQKHSGKKK